MDKTYTIEATITVRGAKSKKDALNELQVMLNDYDDLNDNNVSIIINVNNTKITKS